MQILNKRTSSATEIINQCEKNAANLISNEAPGIHKELARYTFLCGYLEAEIIQLCILRDDLIQQLEDIEDDS